MRVYELHIFRKLKWSSYINTRKSEQKMINNFRETFGAPEEVVVGFGDWEQRKNMKFHEPTKGKGMRTLLRKAGYQVFLVDEHKTSCRCHNCQSDDGVNSTFRKCQNPRPWRKDTITTRHGLLKCKTCSGLWNRDLNSSLNIRLITENAIEGLGRPEFLMRNTLNAARS